MDGVNRDSIKMHHLNDTQHQLLGYYYRVESILVRETYYPVREGKDRCNSK